MKLVITMSRRFGTGASVIAKELSERLDIPVYDKAYIEHTIDDKMYDSEAEAIRELAKSPCIILGRCANYLLMDKPYVLKLFIHAPLEARLSRVASYSLAWSQHEVARHIRVEDKRRAAYYHYYTGEEWRDAAGYDLSLDTDKLGEDGCVEFIKKILPLYEK